MTFKIRILYWLLFTFVCLGSLRAQYSISVDSDCVTQNSVLISRLLIKELGEEKVKYYLENNIRFVVYFTIDSTGKEEFYKVRVFPDSLTNIISSELRTIKIERNYFSICYAPLANHSEETSLAIIAKDFFKENDYFIYHAAFPGELMNYYLLEKEKLLKKGKNITKYEYLESKIENCHKQPVYAMLAFLVKDKFSKTE